MSHVNAKAKKVTYAHGVLVNHIAGPFLLYSLYHLPDKGAVSRLVVQNDRPGILYNCNLRNTITRVERPDHISRVASFIRPPVFILGISKGFY